MALTALSFLLLVVVALTLLLAGAISLGASLVSRVSRSVLLSALAAPVLLIVLILFVSRPTVPASPVMPGNHAGQTRIEAIPTQGGIVPVRVATIPGQVEAMPAPAEATKAGAASGSPADASPSTSTLRIVLKALLRAVDEVEARKPPASPPGVAVRQVEAVEAVEKVHPADRPSWAEASPHLEGADYLVPIAVGPYLSEVECEGHLAEEAQVAVRRYIDEYLPDDVGSGIRGKVTLPWDYVESRLVRARWVEHKQFSVGPMVRLHVLLAFDAKARQRIREVWEEQVVQQRIAGLGGLGLTSLAVFAAVWGFLKIRRRPSPF